VEKQFHAVTSGETHLRGMTAQVPLSRAPHALWAVAAQSFHLGDSARTDDRAAWQAFFAKLEACAALEAPWTLVLQDPLANSFVSSVVDDPRADPRMVIEARRCK